MVTALYTHSWNEVYNRVTFPYILNGLTGFRIAVDNFIVSLELCPPAAISRLDPF